jgi:DNA-binding NarL/FixJ family response regulator
MALRVYVVEDSALVFERLRESMEEVGAKPIGNADDATGAIAAIDALRPDVVVVDIALREGTGLHVLKEIGELPEEDRPVRVVLTNFSRQWYRDAAKRLGAEYFFDKSCEIPQLIDVLRSMSAAELRVRAPARAPAHV